MPERHRRIFRAQRLADGARNAGPWEFGAVIPSWIALRRAPRGDGYAVIVVFPGLAANDASTLPLRSYLGRLGYRVAGWTQGFNLGPRTGVLENAAWQVRETARQSGGPVSRVGWSLGGIYARPSAWWAVADRLAQPRGQWKRFERKRGLHGLIFPDPAR